MVFSPQIRLAFYGLAMALVLILAVLGCVERYTMDECWDKVLPRDANMAAGMADMEKARTEAATEAKIKLMIAGIEIFMILGMIGCVGGAFLGKFFNSKIATRLCIIGILVFGVGWALMATKIQYPKVMAIAGLVMVLSVVACFVVVVIVNRKALVQVVTGNEHYKGRLVSDNHIFGSEQEKVQTPTTTKIVSKIRNGA